MKNKFEKLLSKLQNRQKIEMCGVVKTRGDAPQHREQGELQQNQIELTIATNSRSPIQNDYGATWDEIIAKDAFDYSINNEDIFCFLDHKMDIEHTIASTRNKTMQINKVENAYKCIVSLDLKNEICAKLLRDVESGIINSNSFIFVPDEVEYIENYKKNDFNPDEEAEITIIHKKAKLLSIDPVVLPFYPQNTIRKDNSKMSEKDFELLRNQLTELESKVANFEKEKRDDEVEALKSKIAELEAKLVAATETQEKEKEPEKSSDEIKTETQTEKEETSNSDEIANSETQIENEVDVKDDEKEKKKNEIEEKSAKTLLQNERAKKLNAIFRANQGEKMSELNFRDTIKNLKNKSVKRGFKNIAVANEDEVVLIENKYNEYRNSNSNFDREIELVSSSALSRGVDGTSLEKGLAYISYINDPEVKSELERVIPELEGAETIELENLDIVKKDVLLPNDNVVSAVAEGSKAVEYNGKTISVEFGAPRYNLEASVNPALSNSTQILDKQELQMKNGWVSDVRKQFYKSLFQHKDVELETLIASNSYKGGITKDAIVGTLETNKFTDNDLINVLTKIDAVYGDETARTGFVMLMHPTTKTYLEFLLKDQKNANWYTNGRLSSFDGVKIIVSNNYPYKVNIKTGEFDGTDADKTCPVVLIMRKDMIVARGLNVVVEDDPWSKKSADQLVRYFRSRGLILATDPCINSIAITIGATGKHKIETYDLENSEVQEKNKKEK